MKCPKCGREMKNGCLFGSKDGALSFAERVPGALENARNAEGFVRLSGPKVGGRASIAARCCETCGMIIIQYGEGVKR